MFIGLWGRVWVVAVLALKNILLILKTLEIQCKSVQDCKLYNNRGFRLLWKNGDSAMCAKNLLCALRTQNCRALHVLEMIWWYSHVLHGQTISSIPTDIHDTDENFLINEYFLFAFTRECPDCPDTREQKNDWLCKVIELTVKEISNRNCECPVLDAWFWFQAGGCNQAITKRGLESDTATGNTGVQIYLVGNICHSKRLFEDCA